MITLRHLVLWLVCCYGVSAAAQTLPLVLHQAVAEITVESKKADLNVELPYAWDKVHNGKQGAARFELSFDVVDLPGEPWGLFAQRVGNAYEMRLNGDLLQREGDLVVFNGGDYAQVPRYITVPPELIRHHNVLRVDIRADVGRKGGLTPLVIGPQPLVLPLYQRSYMLRGTGSLLVAVFSLLVGTLSLLLWLTHPIVRADGSQQRDPLYLYAAMAELFWSFGVGYMFFEVPLVPWPWWGALPISAGIIWTCSMVLFCMEVVGWTALSDFRWFKRWLWVMIAGAPVVTLVALVLGHPLVLTGGYAINVLTNICFASVLLSKSFRQKIAVHKLIAIAFMVNVLVGFRDLYVYRIDPSYTSVTWLRYSSMLFGLTLVYVVLSRFRQASAQAHELTQTLAVRVAAKELELKDSFARLEVLAREQERSAERTRILRDMHDGVGAHISTAIRQLQSGQAKDNEVLLTLRESLDQLKLSIDAMNLPTGDITALLANLRYRLEPRFKASDIELQWDVELLVPLPSLDDKGMRHLQFLVYGAIANVLQHAGASMLRIEAQRNEHGIRVRVVDNGCGFDTTVPKRKGLLSMEERAKAIGATMVVRSAPGATVVEFLIS